MKMKGAAGKAVANIVMYPNWMAMDVYSSMRSFWFYRFTVLSSRCRRSNYSSFVSFSVAHVSSAMASGSVMRPPTSRRAGASTLRERTSLRESRDPSGEGRGLIFMALLLGEEIYETS
jgi:hypothetical protein